MATTEMNCLAVGGGDDTTEFSATLNGTIDITVKNKYGTVTKSLTAGSGVSIGYAYFYRYDTSTVTYLRVYSGIDGEMTLVKSSTPSSASVSVGGYRETSYSSVGETITGKLIPS